MIEFLKKTINCKDLEGNSRQWIIIMDGSKITEVKMIYEVDKYKGEYILLDDTQLIKFLTEYKLKNK
tara:strand:- start:670 stop:870 length:201 start_codon:yes stop_codon:yes gene_type:complete